MKVWFWWVRFRPELWFPSLAYLRACVGWTVWHIGWLVYVAVWQFCWSDSLKVWWWRLVPLASRMWLKVAVLATWPVTLQKCNQLSQSTLVWAKCNWWHFVTFFVDTLSRGVLIQNGWCYSIRHYVAFPFPCDSFCLWLTLNEHWSRLGVTCDKLSVRAQVCETLYARKLCLSSVWFLLYAREHNMCLCLI